MSEQPTIAVVGAGAIGGAMAAALGDAGHTVHLCVRAPFERLSRSLEGREASYGHPVHTAPAGLSPVDWVLLCTKAHQIAEAAPWLHALVGPATRIAVMQNGVDHQERVAAWVPAERAVPCIIMLPVRRDAPGAVVQARPGVVQVPADAGGEALRALFGSQEAVAVDPAPDFVSALWMKLVLNAAGGAVCALALKPLGAMAEPVVHDLVIALCEEVMAVGRAEGAQFPEDFAAETVEYFKGPIRTHWTSMAADRRDGRSMEWDARNAVVGRLGRRHGVATPMNDALTALLALADLPD